MAMETALSRRDEYYQRAHGMALLVRELLGTRFKRDIPGLLHTNFTGTLPREVRELIFPPEPTKEI